MLRLIEIDVQPATDFYFSECRVKAFLDYLGVEKSSFERYIIAANHHI